VFNLAADAHSDFFAANLLDANKHCNNAISVWNEKTNGAIILKTLVRSVLRAMS